jgi:hypothetical protein
LFTWRRLARQAALSPATMFVPAVVDRVEPKPALLIKAPRRVRRRAHVDGIELEIAGVEVRIGSRLCGNGLRLWSQPIPHSAPLL